MKKWNIVTNEVKKSRVARGSLAALVVAASLAATSTTALGAIVCVTSGLPAVVQIANVDGLYLNFVTGIVVNSTGNTPGWDFNPFSSTGTPAGSLNLFTSAGAGNVNNVACTGTNPTVIASGTPIGPALTYCAAGNIVATAWRLGAVDQFVGVRFNNESTATLNFGWVKMTTTAPTGFPTTVTSACFDNTGAAIMAGTLPVALQKFSVE